MKNKLKIIEINDDEISLDMFIHFERKQIVNKIYCFIDGIKKLKEIYFVDDWIMKKENRFLMIILWI